MFKEKIEDAVAALKSPLFRRIVRFIIILSAIPLYIGALLMADFYEREWIFAFTFVFITLYTIFAAFDYSIQLDEETTLLKILWDKAK